MVPTESIAKAHFLLLLIQLTDQLNLFCYRTFIYF